MSIGYKLVSAGAAIMCAALLAACGNKNSESPPVSTHAEDTSLLKIHGAGSTFVAPLMQRWIDDYEQSHSGVAFTYDAVGSGEGIERFIAGGAYPVVSLTWLLPNKWYPDPAKGAALQLAVDWGLGPGQAVAEQMGYIPLSASLVGHARQALHALD